MTIAAGIDVGTGDRQGGAVQGRERQGRMAVALIRCASASAIRWSWRASPSTHVLEDAKLKDKDVDYVATTGEGESVPFHTGHFYSMTTHARGAIYLDPAGARRRSTSARCTAARSASTSAARC